MGRQKQSHMTAEQVAAEIAERWCHPFTRFDFNGKEHEFEGSMFFSDVFRIARNRGVDGPQVVRYLTGRHRFEIHN